MIVRMTCSVVWFGRAYHDGDEIDLPDEVAMKYIAAGSAERIAPTAPPIEVAALPSYDRGRKHARTSTTRT